MFRVCSDFWRSKTVWAAISGLLFVVYMYDSGEIGVGTALILAIYVIMRALDRDIQGKVRDEVRGLREELRRDGAGGTD